METTETVQAHVGKAQVVDNVPKVIKELQFGILSVSVGECYYIMSNMQAGRVRILSIKHRSKCLTADSLISIRAAPSILMDLSTLAWASRANEMSVPPVI